MIRVLLVDDIPTTLDNLRTLLSFESDIDVCGTANDGRTAVDEARRLSPDLVLMDVNMPVMDGIQATEMLAQELPGSPVIVMSVQSERDYLRRAMQAGAREFLIKPFSGDELTAAVRRVHATEQRRKGSSLTRAAPTAAITAEAPRPVRSPAAGEVVVVFSGKGGVGTSMVAANLSVALSQETGARVALIDLDLQFGDIGVLLDLDHSRSITDLVRTDGIDAGALDECLATGPGGVRVLLAPTSPELADLVSSDHVRAAMAEMRKHYDYIVVDTASHLAKFNLDLLEAADRVVVVTALTVPAIKNATLTLSVLESLNVNQSKIALVVNRNDGHSSFDKQRIEASLGYPIATHIPFEPRLISDSVTKGKPFVSAQPQATISQSIRELVRFLVPPERSTTVVSPSKVQKKGPRFRFWRKRVQ